jgi:FHA domain-containing protein
MLTLRVVSPPADAARGLSASFGPEGGTIGRATTCTLALPDPEQHISRVQAEVRSTPGGWLLLNRGSTNPLTVGGRTIGPGDSHPVRDGDEIGVAQFTLRASVAAVAAHAPKAAAAGPDPFGDLLPRTSVRPGGAASPVGTAPSVAAGAAPRGLFDLPSTPAAPGPAAGGLIPDDFDPLGMVSMPGASPSSGNGSAAPSRRDADESARSPLGLPLTPTPQIAPPESIDLLFDLSEPGTGAGAGAGADVPHASGPQIASDASMSDHVPEIHSPMRLPGGGGTEPSAVYRSWDTPEAISPTVIVGRGAAIPPATPVAPPSASARPVPSPAPPPRGRDDPLAALVDDAADQHRRGFEPLPSTRPTDLLDEMSRRASPRGRDPQAAPTDAPAPTPTPTPTPAVRSAAAGHDASPADDAALLAAFLQGAGLADWPRGARSLDTAAMRRLGELMRLMTQGTIDLLVARAAAKREMRADSTVIVARQNNPLKFSPDASSALPHLLTAQPARGFVDGRAAVTDAFDDLLAHQAGVVAGMRAAMQGLITRFDPAVLEKRLKDPSLIDTMLPMNRKARLWELFGELYGDLSREAEDDFEALFGREFRRAYEAQIERLERSRPL